MRITSLAMAAVGLVSLTAQAAPLMSADWAVQACQSWNSNPILTDELAEKWIKNDKGRGYKIMHMYRTDCGEGAKIEMTISAKNGKALCTYAGPIQHVQQRFTVTNLSLVVIAPSIHREHAG